MKAALECWPAHGVRNVPESKLKVSTVEMGQRGTTTRFPGPVTFSRLYRSQVLIDGL